jgi:hypothetical protein
MIKFFRHVRQHLIEDNKMRKYIIYAIGEIILVVIGILLALQINNWNENRKAKQYEDTMLLEIRQALDSDITNQQQNVIRYLKQTEHSLKELTKMRTDPGYPRDSIKTHLTRLQKYGVFFQIDDGPFQALKSNGLDKISNQELRKKLTRLYGNRLTSVDQWINNIIRPLFYEKNQQFDALFKTEIQLSDSEEIIESFEVGDIEVLIRSNGFRQLLNIVHESLSNTLRRLEYTVRNMQDIKHMIDKELQY